MTASTSPNPLNTPVPTSALGRLDQRSGNVLINRDWYRFLTTMRTNVTSQLYQVGDIYHTTDPTNPGVKFGYGTWELFAQGEALFGYKATDPNFHPVEHTGGSATVTPAGNISATFTGAPDTTSAVSAGTPAGSVAVTIAPYTPTGNVTSAAGASPGGNTTGLAFVGDSATLTGNATFTGAALGTHTHTVTPTGSVAATFAGASETNLPPYIVVFIWRRTA